MKVALIVMQLYNKVVADMNRERSMSVNIKIIAVN